MAVVGFFGGEPGGDDDGGDDGVDEDEERGGSDPSGERNPHVEILAAAITAATEGLWWSWGRMGMEFLLFENGKV